MTSNIDTCGILFNRIDFNDITGCLRPNGHNDSHLCKSSEGRFIAWDYDYYCRCGCWNTDDFNDVCIIYSDITDYKIKIINMTNPSMLKDAVRPRRMNSKGEEKNLLWSDLKEFVNSLNDEQLQQEILVWDEDGGGGMIYSISITEDDMINPSGEGLEPISLYSNSDDAEDIELAKYEPIILRKGAIILNMDTKK